MGRYSTPLAPLMADYARVVPGQRVVDVGCGPGALTTELVQRVGPDGVSAVDPSEPFVAAAKERHPGVDVRLASAEQLPFDDDAFDGSLAQLVVHFMADPVKGLQEMGRVTRPGGVVAACVWDHAGGTGAAEHVLGSCAHARRRRRRRVPARRRPRRPSRSCSSRRGWATSKTRRSPSPSSSRASTSGGSRSRAASARQARTWRASTPSSRRVCASAVVQSSTHGARARPCGPGPRAAWRKGSDYAPRGSPSQ
jgi:Methylase involved in ubiquinone/menaquinone biosynthesis